MNRLLVFLAGAALATLALSPGLHRWLWSNPNRQPVTPAGHQPRYAIGGRYVTREEFDDYTNKEHQ